MDPRLEAEALAPWEPHTLYHATQQRNTLYARLALYDDRYLALGCNTGDVVLWDTRASLSPHERGVLTDGCVLPRAHDTKYVPPLTQCGSKRSQLEPRAAWACPGLGKRRPNRTDMGPEYIATGTLRFQSRPWCC